MFASAIWLVPQIADVSICCGLKEDASEVQIKLVAAAIASKYKYLKTDEVMLFLFNFKAGFYERFYSYFDPQTIIKSIPTFLHMLRSQLCWLPTQTPYVRRLSPFSTQHKFDCAKLHINHRLSKNAIRLLSSLQCFLDFLAFISQFSKALAFISKFTSA